MPQATNFEMLSMNANKYKLFLSPVDINDELYLKYKNYDICYYNLLYCRFFCGIRRDVILWRLIA